MAYDVLVPVTPAATSVLHVVLLSDRSILKPVASVTAVQARSTSVAEATVSANPLGAARSVVADATELAAEFPVALIAVTR